MKHKLVLVIDSKFAKIYAATAATSWLRVRLSRNFLLDETDWVFVEDSGVSADDKELYKTYRKKLRDLPADANTTDAAAVKFPINPQYFKDIYLKNGRFGPYLQYEKEKDEVELKKKKGRKKKNENDHLKNVSIPKGIDIDSVDLDKAKYLCSLPKVLGQHPENGHDITLNSGRFGPYLKCENKSARLENVEDLFSIGLNRAITMIAEAKPGRISSSLIKDLGEHPEDKKPVRIMKGQYGPYIKYKSLNATIPEEKDPNELNMEEALILIEKRKEYDKSKKKKKR